MIKAVIFDLDNTLYDYDRCNQLAEKRLFECIASEFHIEEAQAAQLLENAKAYVKNRLEGTAAAHNRLLYMQNLCEQLEENPLLHAMRFYNAYWDTMLEEMHLFPYVLPLLEKLKEQNISIGLLTDLTAQIQYRKIEKLGLGEWIDVLVTSEEAGEEKPSQKMFALMLEKLGVEPQEALMIGDSLSKDIEGARKLGLHAIHFDADHMERFSIDEDFDCNSLLQ